MRTARVVLGILGVWLLNAACFYYWGASAQRVRTDFWERTALLYRDQLRGMDGGCR